MSTPIGEQQTLPMLVKPLVEQFNYFCTQYDLVGKVVPDHVCLKCSSSAIYEKRREGYEKESVFMYQSDIGGRRISYFKLKENIPASGGDIMYLELSDQKPDGSQIDRVDHIEIVPVGGSYEELVAYLKEKGVELVESTTPHHPTHNIILPSGFTLKLSREFLIEKIKREEMV